MGCIPGGFLEEVTSKPCLRMCAQFHPSVPGFCQIEYRTPLSSSPRGTALGFTSPIQGLILTLPVRHWWQFPRAAGNPLRPRSAGPRALCLPCRAELRARGASLISPLQLWRLHHGPVCSAAASERERGAILGSEGCNFCRTEKTSGAGAGGRGQRTDCWLLSLSLGLPIC